LARNQIQKSGKVAQPKGDPGPEPSLYQSFYEQIRRANRGKPWLDPSKTDWSRMDWMIAKDMLRAGHPANEVCSAIMASPGLAQRKDWGPTHTKDYAWRTVRNAGQQVAQWRPL
jgi:hypothetical protein